MGSYFTNPCRREVCRGGEVARDRLVLVEPHGILREGLAGLISARIPEAVVQSFSRVEDVSPRPAALALIGLDPRRGDSGEAARAKLRDLRALCGDPPIGVVLASDDAATTRNIGGLGVAGVVRHDATLAVAIAAIQLMWVGGFYLPPDLVRVEETAPAWPPHMGAALAPPLTSITREPQREVEGELTLTSRECDVLRILREGRQNKIIAFELGISESTVKVHLRNIMKKLHASNRTQVALGAISAD
jgi:DNA-binding NarL/FixJ family response regulator